jgi:hypothetical protein
MTSSMEGRCGPRIEDIDRFAQSDPVDALRLALTVQRQIDGQLLELYGRVLLRHPSPRQQYRAEAAMRALRHAIPRTNDAIRRLERSKEIP